MKSSTVSTDLRLGFEKEVTIYAKELASFLDGAKDLFGSSVPVQMPKSNITEIQSKYIQLGKVELTKQGVQTRRAQSVSKYTFETLLEVTMKDLEAA